MNACRSPPILKESRGHWCCWIDLLFFRFATCVLIFFHITYYRWFRIKLRLFFHFNWWWWGHITRQPEHLKLVSKYEINECESPNKTRSLPNWNWKEYVHFVDTVLSQTAYISFSVRRHPLTQAKGIAKPTSTVYTNTQEQRSGESQKKNRIIQQTRLIYVQVASIATYYEISVELNAPSGHPHLLRYHFNSRKWRKQ